MTMDPSVNCSFNACLRQNAFAPLIESNMIATNGVRSYAQVSIYCSMMFPFVLLVLVSVNVSCLFLQSDAPGSSFPNFNGTPKSSTSNSFPFHIAECPLSK